MKRGGFTIIELVVSIAIMFIVIVAALPIFFKKATKTTDPVKQGGLFVCSCVNHPDGVCVFKPENAYKQEFYTIQVLGGGAGGGTSSNKKGGGAGEARTVFYPFLPSENTEYRIVLGEGGVAGKNGGQTTIYKVTGSDSTVLEYARGGITTNEDAEMQDGIMQTSGATAAFNENGCGKGGDATMAGTMGEVIIRW